VGVVSSMSCVCNQPQCVLAGSLCLFWGGVNAFKERPAMRLCKADACNCSMQCGSGQRHGMTRSGMNTCLSEEES
jgi:hypothetical protein